MQLIKIVIVVVIIIATSCTEKFDLKLESNETKLVVEGIINNLEGPYFVRLTQSTNDMLLSTLRWDTIIDHGAQAALGAFITISDDVGNIDTLIPSPYNDMLHMDSTLGYYQTTNIKGVSGRKYTIDVLWEGEQYTASSSMPFPSKLNNLELKVDPGPTGKYDYIIPIVYFSKEENNFFLTNIFCSNDQSPSFDEVGKGIAYHIKFKDEFISILSTTYSDPKNGVSLYNMFSEWNDPYLLPHHTSHISAMLIGIDDAAYRYFSVLSAQLKGDGGAYKPSPATPPGNMSNGALGVFMATSVTDIRVENPLGENYY